MTTLSSSAAITGSAPACGSPQVIVQGATADPVCAQCAATFPPTAQTRRLVRPVCETSCTRCLNDYSNQGLWPEFERRPALAWVEAILLGAGVAIKPKWAA